jgi:anti-anti-sigma factor
MRFESEYQNGVRVVTVFGHWTGGHDDDTLRDQLHVWIAARERSFVLDLSQLDLLNSIGLGRLVSYYTTLTREGGSLSLAGLQDKHRRAAYVARILDLFEDYDTVQAAVSAAASTD